MYTYISMLRGINVSGQKKIRMEDLRALYGSLGLSAVQSYIQSGNIIFNSRKSDQSGLARSISNAIRECYGFYVPVVIRTSKEIQNVINNNPYLKNGNKDNSKLHVTFLSDMPTVSAVNQLEPPVTGKEELSVKGREIYLYCPNGYGKTKLTNTFFEKRLSVAATTRNWKTVNTLLEMATR
jgi:uncharacterized protein (DUF1697 family)